MLQKLIGALVGLVVIAAAQSSPAGNSDQNLKIMIDAARKLEHSLPENRAYLLIKRETIRSEIGVIFGYTDNDAACRQIAKVLSEGISGGQYPRLFECAPIY